MSISLSKASKGFTLIELLVVIAIIGLLSSVVLASLSTARSKGRDARRVADMGQLQLALEMYYDASSTYPTYSSSGNAQSWAAVPANGIGFLKPNYIPNIPDDPATNSYYYCPMTVKGASTCDGATTATVFIVGANLENSVTTNGPLATDADILVGASGSRKFDGTSGSCIDATTAGPEKCYDISN